jgi:ABC-2 type transport system permease protein
MSAVRPFAVMTVMSLARRRTLWGIGILTVLGLACLGAVPAYGTGASPRFVLDIGISLMEIAALVMAIAIGSGMVTRDRDSRTMMPLLAAPLSRDEYLAGRFLGAAFVQSVFTMLWFAGLAAVLAIRGDPVPGGLAPAGMLLCAEGWLILSIVVLFSLWASPPLNAPLTLLVFILSSTSPAGFASLVPWAGSTALLLRTLIPRLAVFQLRDPLVHGLHVTPVYALIGLVYGISYSLLVLALASAVFRRRDLK